MRIFWKLSLSLCLSLSLTFIGTQSLKAAAGQPKPRDTKTDSSEKMIGDAYTVFAFDKFLNPQPTDKASIQQALIKLKSVAHPINLKPTGPKISAAMQFLTLNPPQTIARLEQAFMRGSYPQAALGIRRVMQQCSECHATTTKPAWASIQPGQGLSLIELADFFKYLGRSDDALLYYEKILTTKGAASSRPDIWERAALNIVALGIETAGSAYTYVDVLSNLLQETTISKKQRELISSWRLQGKAWGLEKNLPSKPGELIEHARQMIILGDTNNRSLPNSGLVAHARAMMELKKAAVYGSAEHKTKAFALSGELREKIIVAGVYLQPADYYEACIRSGPKAPESSRCWGQLSSLSQRDPKFTLDSETNQQLQALMH